MGIRDEAKKCGRASSDLDKRMFDTAGNRLDIDDNEKASILERADWIGREFSRLSELLEASPRDTRLSNQLADIYYDWGIHCKQQAWFHDGLIARDTNARQSAILANQEAIQKMERAYALYSTQRAKNATHVWVVQYKKDAQLASDPMYQLSTHDVSSNQLTQVSQLSQLKEKVDDTFESSESSEASDSDDSDYIPDAVFKSTTSKRTVKKEVQWVPKKKSKVEDDADIGGILRKLKKEITVWSQASSDLDKSMFDALGHVLEINDDEKASILERAELIGGQFQRLVTELKRVPEDVRVSKSLADVYFNHGLHCKQQAWFHSGFMSRDVDAWHHAIVANHEAIQNMRQAHGLYQTKKEQDDTEKLIVQYEKDDNFARTAAPIAAHPRLLERIIVSLQRGGPEINVEQISSRVAEKVGREENLPVTLRPDSTYSKFLSISSAPVQPDLVTSSTGAPSFLHALTVNTESPRTSVPSMSSVSSGPLSCASAPGNLYLRKKQKGYCKPFFATESVGDLSESSAQNSAPLSTNSTDSTNGYS